MRTATRIAKAVPLQRRDDGDLADLSTFEPLLATAEKKTPLAGSFVVNWNGQGEIANFKNDGDLNLKLESGRYAELQNLQANVEAHYTPQELNVPIVFLGSDKLIFQASLTRKTRRSRSAKSRSTRAPRICDRLCLASFYLEQPRHRSRRFPPNGKVAINFQSENLDLAKLFQDLGKEPPVAGSLT